MARPPAKTTNPALDLIEPMIAGFLNKERVRQRATLEALVSANHAAGGNPYGYYFQGKRFSLLATRFLVGQPINIVEPSLRQQAEDFDLAATKLEHDAQKLMNGLTVVLSRCSSFQDVRDVLPEPLVQIFPQLSCLPRIQDEGWVLLERPVLRTQYEKTIAIALYYQVNNLIF